MFKYKMCRIKKNGWKGLNCQKRPGDIPPGPTCRNPQNHSKEITSVGILHLHRKRKLRRKKWRHWKSFCIWEGCTSHAVRRPSFRGRAPRRVPAVTARVSRRRERRGSRRIITGIPVKHVTPLHPPSPPPPGSGWERRSRESATGCDGTEKSGGTISESFHAERPGEKI